jgi:phage tail sheath protein FI
VRTIAGVGTSITAFVGYTRRGSVNKPTQLFSFADYERAFGGLDRESQVSYAVQQFFRNGGNEARVVRVATGTATASVDLYDKAAQGKKVLTVRAVNPGVWGNNVLVTVDYDAANPLDQFNLSVVAYSEPGGERVVDSSERHANLSMNPAAPNYAVDTVAASSELVRLEPVEDLHSDEVAVSESGSLAEGELAWEDIGPDKRHSRLALSIDNEPPLEVGLPTLPAGADPANGNRLKAIGEEVVDKVKAAGFELKFTLEGATDEWRLKFETKEKGEARSIRFLPAAQHDAAGALSLGNANGGREADGSAVLRPMRSGTVSDDLTAVALGTLTDALGTLTIDRVERADVELAELSLGSTAPSTLEQLRTALEGVLRAAAATSPEATEELSELSVLLVDNQLQIVPAGPGDSVLAFADEKVAKKLGLSKAKNQNVGRYRLGVGADRKAQKGAEPGDDGSPPGEGDLRGNEMEKEGIYALEDTEFNLLCLPAQAGNALLADAMEYCERRRAFLIVDPPEKVTDPVAARTWVNAAATPKSKNAAAYFPWIELPDPLSDDRLRPFPPSGTLAGLYARTDTARGVWKAPAGTEAALRGPQGVVYPLTDDENGSLNPLGLNSVRSLPVYGFVSWGARTLEGSDQKASEWKYVPVRRLALFIEESLYRGTQWVVFEPNDDPLWAQIRLNVGAFMHDLFRQGAFQGSSPRSAYMVKCDSETTTQNDIDKGIVNVLVGFAPLKPAEFVFLKISQLAGKVEV